MYPSMPMAFAPDSPRTEGLRRGITTIHLAVMMTLCEQAALGKSSFSQSWNVASASVACFSSLP